VDAVEAERGHVVPVGHEVAQSQLDGNHGVILAQVGATKTSPKMGETIRGWGRVGFVFNVMVSRDLVGY